MKNLNQRGTVLRDTEMLQTLVRKNKALFEEAEPSMKKSRTRWQDHVKFINESIERSKLTIFPHLHLNNPNRKGGD
jgi:hypothetical protein